MADNTMRLTVQTQTRAWRYRDWLYDQYEVQDPERGSVTAQTAMIFLLVGGAILAGGIIVGKMQANANNIPAPGAIGP